MTKTLIATMDTFTKGGRFVPRGAPLSADEVDFDKDSPNLTEAPKDFGNQKAIPTSAIAPTGPNPVAPQQIAPGVVQTEAGYFDRGARVVGDVTKPAKERMVEIVDDGDTTQGDVQAKLDEHAQAQGADRAANSATIAAGTGPAEPTTSTAAPARAPAAPRASRSRSKK